MAEPLPDAQRRRVYLDWNATTPPHADVLAAMAATAAVVWGNPASVHREGQRARHEVEAAREAVARLVVRDPVDVTLTSGGTEANNLALAQPFLGEAGVAVGSLVLSRIEHPSVVKAAETLARRGVDVRFVEVGTDGRVDPNAVEAVMAGCEKLAMVSLQAVNHETGVIQSVEQLAPAVAARGAHLHVDAVQAVGKVAAEAWRAADWITVASHKIRGPKGVGAVIGRPGLKLQPLLRGGEQEKGARPGTQDPVAAAGFAVAADRAKTGPARYRGLAQLRDDLERRLTKLAADAGLKVGRNGTASRVPHVSNLSWEGWRGDELCAALDLEGVAVSSGSACSAGSSEPSKIITAMLGPERARGAVRISLGEDTVSEDVDRAVAAFQRVFSRLESA
ncbi:MAG: cysteine desulfurase family protein [Polyangiaceae bacterium]